jgi:hypothetical protein
LKTPTPTRLPNSLEWREFVWKSEEHIELQEILMDDFNVAEELFIARDAGFTRRHMVRCFGSFVDAMAVTLRDGVDAFAALRSADEPVSEGQDG